jgi:dsDNA-specific endonuclease/ATPase MutS2
VKAINEDYLEYRGKKKRPPVEFSDSDSNFDLPPFKLIKAATNSNLKIWECIDLTTSGDGQMSNSAANAEFTKLKDVTARIEKIESGLSKSLEKQEELERIVSCLEEKRALERSIVAMKNQLVSFARIWQSFRGWCHDAVPF